MSLFKDILKQDLEKCFLNTDEFAQEINFDGQTIIAIVDDGDTPYQGQAADGFADASGLGLLQGGRTVFCSADALPQPPLPGQRVLVDGLGWLVASVNDEHGLLRIVLNRAYA